MEWIKIKVSHTLMEYSDFTEKQIGAWVVAMCLTGALEKMPTEAQLKKYIHGSTLNSLKSGLSSHGVTLEYVLSKVLDDVEYTKSIKETNRSKIAKWREKKKNVTSNVTVTEPDKRREEKRREEKIDKQGNVTHFEDLWKAYPPKNKNGKDTARKRYSESVKTDKDRADIDIALKNYKATEKVEKGFILRASKWFEEWKDYIVVETKESGAKAWMKKQS